MIRGASLAVAALAAGLASPAFAVCADAMNCSCTISSSGLTFGNYDPHAPAPNDSVGTITASCESNDPGDSTFSIALSAGNSSTSSQRTLASGTSELLYNLYTNATRSTIWGDDSGGGVSVIAAFPPSNGSVRIVNVYGRIAARQNVAPGVYGDVIIVTITY